MRCEKAETGSWKLYESFVNMLYALFCPCVPTSCLSQSQGILANIDSLRSSNDFSHYSRTKFKKSDISQFYILLKVFEIR